MSKAQLYFLTDQYYIDFPDDKLMKNKDVIDGTPHNRPCFFAFPDALVLAKAKRGAKVVFPDIFKIYQVLEQQLQSEKKNDNNCTS